MKYSKLHVPNSDEIVSATTALHQVLGNDGLKQIEFIDADGRRVHVELPKPSFDLLKSILLQLSMGNGVAIHSYRPEMYTHELANLFGITRRQVSSLLEKGLIPFSKVDGRILVKLRDAMDYMSKCMLESQETLDGITAQAQEQGLYD